MSFFPATSSGGTFANLSVSTSFAYGSSTRSTDLPLILNGAGGTFRLVTWQTAGVKRFDLGVSNGAESGGNAGTDFFLNAFDDGGNFIGTLFNGYRANGVFSINNVAVQSGVIMNTSITDSTAATPAAGDSSTALATTAFVGTATNGMVTLSTTGGTTTLAQAQYSAPVLLVTGALTSNAVLIYPNSRVMTVSNNTTGAFSLTVRTAAGTGVVVPQGFCRYLIANGVNVVRGSNETPASAALQWTGGAVVANGTYYFTVAAPYAGTITSLDYFTGAGSFTVAVQVGAAVVTGLSAVAVSSATQANAAATGANTFAAGQMISVVISAAANSPTNAVLNLRITKA